MKKGFTMIELIFVIVILGILASVAIPRLAGTKADAEISAAVANLRTLVSDANVYYVAKGGFEATGSGAATSITTTWSQITNVPVDDPNKAIGNNNSLKVGGVNCIDFLIRRENAATNQPAYILFAKNTKNTAGGGATSPVCQQVQNSSSLAHYFTSRVPGVSVSSGDANKGFIAIGSNTKLEK